ncbi:MAG: hypothetical protein E7L01_20590 [Paenibacillus macerans]|uniref:Uncharacterized protein n=1 Tax=Paenibacillus macerans TaxID=44252 RepID=A0A090ZQV6_PAEMA|nr:DUF6809 family protein [Paenibacillus macerans]KFN06516.1 hypothetical protein DJ90_4152 [Paenibacillus macerans]MCY7558136.1 hypothetical protein [Paenibacillus macerans]MDU7475708.1 hypothetical protein [Paenibacillus macerans]MEC0153744.1 hypothetical protein [Paenibacillus macerans]MEC0332211.1 hypothetical protein [Paenibacillus macerans]
MKTILEALYHGQLHPDEVIVPSQPEYRSVSRQVAAQTEQWRERLGEEAFRELEEYFDLCDSVDSMHIEEAFLHGFRLGANLIIEVMSNREELVPNVASGISL